MTGSRFLRTLAGLAVPLLVVGGSWVHGSSPPIRQYTIADGLPFDSVSRVKSDTRGFLWLCTGGGLSRFDGPTGWPCGDSTAGMQVSAADSPEDIDQAIEAFVKVGRRHGVLPS